nr:immunoglobulin light chain junction region [Macaca mulatta]
DYYGGSYRSGNTWVF